MNDLGTDSEVAVDYPIYCSAVGREVAAGRAERGIVLGGSGQGEQLSANKVKGVRAALCNDLYTSEYSRRHNDANVLSIGARVVGEGLADEILRVWLDHRVRGRPPPAPHRPRSPPSRTERCRRDHGITASSEALPATDPEIADIIRRETVRQNTTIQLIASENFTSPAVLAAQGSVLTNKYSEGYPGKRYYGGNLVVDEAEELARRPPLRAVRRRARQRAAPLGRQRQHGRVPRAARPGRQGDGDASRPGRPPHPRLAGELQRPPLRLRRPTASTATRSASTTTRCGRSRSPNGRS